MIKDLTSLTLGSGAGRLRYGVISGGVSRRYATLLRRLRQVLTALLHQIASVTNRIIFRKVIHAHTLPHRINNLHSHAEQHNHTVDASASAAHGGARRLCGERFRKARGRKKKKEKLMNEWVERLEWLLYRGKKGLLKT